MAWEIALVLTFVGVAFALFFAGQGLDKEHSPLKLLFLVVGLVLLLANFGNTTKIIEANNNSINNATISTALTTVTDTSYSSFIWVIVFIIVYFIIYFFIKLAKSIKLKHSEEDGN